VTWTSLAPADAARLMRGYDRRWWVGGGWAIDLFLGRTTREHDDVDVVVPRAEQQLVRAHFADWDLHVAPGGSLTPWHGEWLKLPIHVIWCRPDAGSLWQLELLLMEVAAGRWHFRRDPLGESCRCHPRGARGDARLRATRHSSGF